MSKKRTYEEKRKSRRPKTQASPHRGRINLNVVATSIILAIQAGDMTYKEFKEMQAKVDAIFSQFKITPKSRERKNTLDKLV